jgi:hypothetical protein
MAGYRHVLSLPGKIGGKIGKKIEKKSGHS